MAIKRECWIKPLSILTLIGVCFLYADLYGQAPAPAKDSQIPQTRTRGIQKPATSNQRGTEQAPIFIKIVPPNKTGPEPTEAVSENTDKSSAEWALVWVTIVLTIIAAGQLVVFGLQARRLRQTVEKMDETAERQLRAYVFAHSVIIRDPNAAMEPMSATVTIKNYGQTPAYNFSCTAYIRLLDFPVQAFPEKAGGASDGPYTKADIPPGATFGSDFEGATLSSGDKIALGEGTKAIYVWGEMRYRDAFQKERFTRFRYMCGGDYGVYSGEMFACQEGNEAN